MKQIFSYLSYAGLIPFLFCTYCLVFGVQELPLLGATEKVLSTYTIVIIAFLSGSHWGQDKGSALAVMSNIIAIFIWISFLTLSFKMLMLIFVLALLTILMIDYHLLSIRLISRKYFNMRCLVSTIVIVCLISSGIIS